MRFRLATADEGFRETARGENEGFQQVWFSKRIG